MQRNCSFSRLDFHIDKVIVTKIHVSHWLQHQFVTATVPVTSLYNHPALDIAALCSSSWPASDLLFSISQLMPPDS